MKRFVIVSGIFAGVFTLAHAATDFAGEGNRWWSHIQVLADDSMGGRNTGSEGHLKAAHYIAEEFEKAGLKPAGTAGYEQPVKFEVAQIDEPHSSLELIHDGQTERLKLGEDAVLSMRGDAAPHTEAPAIFAGYGLKIPEKKWDDFSGLDVRGKIVVMITGGPKSIPGPLKAHYSSERWKQLRALGAVGVAIIPNPKSMDIPWSRSSLARFQPAMKLSDASLDESKGEQIAIGINPEHAGKFLAGTGHTITEILADADADKPIPHFPLKEAIRADLAVKRSQVESQNVAAMLPGSDPKLKSEYVILSAHLDHVGIGEPINGDKIYNGAMDDASGVATVLEVARMLKERDVHPKRSLLFLAVTGEEKGLLGSKYFAAHPTVDASHIVADINLDMFLPLHALKYLEVQGLDESTLGDDIRAVAAKNDIQIQSDKEPQRNLFVRSDQYSFIRRGIPALAFKFGYLPGSPEEKLHKDWLKNRYHAPSDDLNQPVDKEAAARFNEVILQLTERVADDSARPEWKSGSFFRRFAATHAD